MSYLWIIGGIAGILIILGIALAFVARKRMKESKKEPNYKAFFIMGISWFPLGIVFMAALKNPAGIAFLGMGLVYMLIGLANRDKWEENK